jgi:hypothetical protein
VQPRQGCSRKLSAAKTGLDGAVRRAQQRLDTLKQEADAKAEALKLRLSQAKGDVKVRIEDRMKRVKSAYHARGAKLSQNWMMAAKGRYWALYQSHFSNDPLAAQDHLDGAR